MTIEPMLRVTLCGRDGDRAAVLEGLQALGCMHLLPLTKSAPLDRSEAPDQRRARVAFRHLADAPQQLRPWPLTHEFEPAKVIHEVLANKTRLREARTLLDSLNARIANLEPFGDFTLPPLEELRGMRLWFYILPVKERPALEQLDIPWQIVGRDNTRLFLALIAREEPPAGILPVPRTLTGDRQISHLQLEAAETEIEIERAEAELAELTRHRLALGLRLAEAEDADDRRAAEGLLHREERLFALQGWAPENMAPDLQEFARANELALICEAPAPGDLPPTLMANPGRFEGASALTSFYQTPEYKDWDPSLIVFFSFALFFSMILADAGYAAVLGLLVASRWKKMGESETGQRMRTMLAVILGCAFVYGVLAASYFGLELPPDSPLMRLKLIDVTDTGSMMMASIIIGVLHVSIANAQVAWLNWGKPVAVVKLGWIAATFGGLAVWLGAGSIGIVLLVGGLIAVVGGSAAEPLPAGTSAKAGVLKRIMAGAMSLAGVSKMFGDILSYMRLFALGLASASLAATFNNLAADLASGLPGAGVLLAIIVLIFGHVANLALGILSGVVHGLRLNFIEFFGWALSGEGYPFKAFARKEKAS